MLINDGYALDGKIPAQGRFPQINLRFRPPLPEQVYAYLQAPRANGKESLRATVDLLLKHLESWDLAHGQGGERASVPLTRESLQRVPYQILERVAAHVITGWTEEEQEKDLKN